MGMLSEDTPCRTCHGQGWHYQWDRFGPSGLVVGPESPAARVTCEDCFGTGVSLTALGQELMEFLKEYFTLPPNRKT